MVIDDPAKLAAAANGPTGTAPDLDASADGGVADAVAQLSTGATSPDAVYRTMITGLGVAARSAAGASAAADAVLVQVDGARQAVSGVSLDEEMTNMMIFKQSYAAAARLVTAVDEMLDILINKPDWSVGDLMRITQRALADSNIRNMGAQRHCPRPAQRADLVGQGADPALGLTERHVDGHAHPYGPRGQRPVHRQHLPGRHHARVRRQRAGHDGRDAAPRPGPHDARQPTPARRTRSRCRRCPPRSRV